MYAIAMPSGIQEDFNSSADRTSRADFVESTIDPFSNPFHDEDYAMEDADDLAIPIGEEGNYHSYDGGEAELRETMEGMIFKYVCCSFSSLIS